MDIQLRKKMFQMDFEGIRSKVLHQLRQFEKWYGFENEVKWTSFFIITFFHIFGIYWSICYAFPAKWQTIVFAILMFAFSGQGITIGVHRLWTHKSYKLVTPLRVWLMLCFASAGQNSIYEWVRDHRLHHKFSDTEADPHNMNRGFWFCHIGWLMMKKNKAVLEKGKVVDMSDILQDPVAMFERKYSMQLSLIFCYILPTLTGILLWNEKWQCAVAWECFIRVLVVLHAEMTVNSLAHMFGYKPYDRGTHDEAAHSRLCLQDDDNTGTWIARFLEQHSLRQHWRRKALRFSTELKKVETKPKKKV